MNPGCALITGASSGIGAATALALAARETQVVAVSRHPERLRDHERFQSLSTRIDPVAGDMTRPDDVDRVFSHSESVHGDIRFVIHSVGFESSIDWFQDAAPDAILDAVAALIASPALVLNRALRSLRHRGGNIGLISSGAANRPTPGRPLYSASKIALDRLMESVAAECAALNDGTAVFSIVPGRVDTPAQHRLMRAARDAPEAFRLNRFRSSSEIVPPDVVGEAIAALINSPPVDLNGAIFRYRPDGWQRTNS